MGVICKALKSDDKGMVELSEIVYFFKKNSKDKKISLKLIESTKIICEPHWLNV